MVDMQESSVTNTISGRGWSIRASGHVHMFASERKILDQEGNLMFNFGFEGMQVPFYGNYYFTPRSSINFDTNGFTLHKLRYLTRHNCNGNCKCVDHCGGLSGGFFLFLRVMNLPSISSCASAGI